MQGRSLTCRGARAKGSRETVGVCTNKEVRAVLECQWHIPGTFPPTLYLLLIPEYACEDRFPLRSCTVCRWTLFTCHQRHQYGGGANIRTF
jgi:hypothetical protein